MHTQMNRHTLDSLKRLFGFLFERITTKQKRQVPMHVWRFRSRTARKIFSIIMYEEIHSLQVAFTRYLRCDGHSHVILSPFARKEKTQIRYYARDFFPSTWHGKLLTQLQFQIVRTLAKKKNANK